MRNSRLMPIPPPQRENRVSCAFQYSFQAEHYQLRIESCQYLKCSDFVGVAIWNWFNLVSLFQFKLSIIPRIFQGWTFDFLTSNPYQKLYYFSTGAIIWPPCRKDNFVRTKKIPILGEKDGLKWRLLQTKECKIVNQTFSTTLSSFYKEAWGSW